MEEKKAIKISLGTLICILVLILLVIVLVGICCYYKGKLENVTNTVENVVYTTENEEKKNSNKENNVNVKEINKLDENKDLVYTSYNKSSSEYKYSLPCINIDSADAKKINNEIEMFFKPLIDEQIKNEAEGSAITIYEINYDYYLNDSILSLVISHLYDSDYISYEVYNLSIYEGTNISNDDILNMKNLKEDEYLNILKSNYEKKFSELYAGHDEFVLDFEDEYENLLNKTIAADNYSIETPIFFNEKGKLCVIANIYSFAGAESYKRIIELDT